MSSLVSGPGIGRRAALGVIASIGVPSVVGAAVPQLATESTASVTDVSIAASDASTREILKRKLAYLEVPVHDGNPSVGHPSVLHIPTGFAGFKYWMAYTPYPDRFREDPCVVASHDGLNWQVPPGLTNPIRNRSWAMSLGFDYNSDTEIVLSPDGAEMWLYWRTAEGSRWESIFRSTSGDGVHWSEPVEVIDTTVRTGRKYMAAMSPSIVVEDDGSLSMWTARNPNVSNLQKIVRRTSTDGVTWSEDSVIRIAVDPAVGQVPVPWHLAVRKISGAYYMLVNTHSAWGLQWLVSDNGVDWSMPGSCVPKTGQQWDSRGHYRSTFIASVTGGVGTADIYLNGMDGSGAKHYSDSWRIGIRTGVELPKRLSTPTAPATQRVYVPASSLDVSPNTTSPTRDFLQARIPIIALASEERIAGGVVGSVCVPVGTKRVRVSVHWANLTPNAGDVRFAVTTWPFDVDGGSSRPATTRHVTKTATSIEVPVISFISAEPVGSDEQFLWIKVARDGLNAFDTLQGSVGIIGISIQPESS